jgi:hypothetical protein
MVHKLPAAYLAGFVISHSLMLLDKKKDFYTGFCVLHDTGSMSLKPVEDKAELKTLIISNEETDHKAGVAVEHKMVELDGVPTRCVHVDFIDYDSGHGIFTAVLPYTKKMNRRFHFEPPRIIRIPESFSGNKQEIIDAIHEGMKTHEHGHDFFTKHA